MNNSIVSWSGGKDSCLALMDVVKGGMKPKYLVTVLTEEGERTRSHGLKKEIIIAQGERLGIKNHFFSAAWEEYHMKFLGNLLSLKAKGVASAVFGDIKIHGDKEWDSHRKWADDLCHSCYLKSVQPLWDIPEKRLVNKYLTSGIFAIIVAVDSKKLDHAYLGRRLDEATILELCQKGIHPMGERGEFHTLVLNCPQYSKPLRVLKKSVHLFSGYWFLDLDYLG